MLEFKMINVGTLTIKIKDFDARHNATFPSDFIIKSQFGFNTGVFKIDGEKLSRNVNCNFLLKLKKVAVLFANFSNFTYKMSPENVENEIKVNVIDKYVAEHKSGEGGHLYFEQGKLTNVQHLDL